MSRKNLRVRIEARQKNAEERLEARSKRTAEQQLQRLDDMLGTGVGAVRERHRLQKEISNKKEKS